MSKPQPVLEAITIGFRCLAAATLLLALAWLASNVRRIPADSQAVVLRFGQIAKVQNAGLLLAWPRPIDSVLILPGPQRRMNRMVAALPRAAGLDNPYTRTIGAPIHGAAGSYLTGDGSVVLLDAVITWHITQPATYALTREHVEPALDRLFRATAIAIVAGRNLDDLLVARPERAASEQIATLRQEVRDEFLLRINQRLASLANGVAIDRLDLTASLPPVAKLAFDSVLTAGQVADQAIAQARTQAEQLRQEAARQHDQVLAAAHAAAAAAERISDAHADVAKLVALKAAITPSTRTSLLDTAYRDQVATLLQKIGSVTAIDPRAGGRVIIPGNPEAPK
jgi:regulator of protease activity HflC (stomatin/prohibitin superfamily)